MTFWPQLVSAIKLVEEETKLCYGSACFWDELCSKIDYLSTYGSSPHHSCWSLLFPKKMRQGPVWLGFAPNKWGQKWPASRQGRTEVPVLGDWSWSLRINDQQDQTGQTWAPAGTLNYTQPARHWTGITKQTVSLCLIHNKDLFAKIKSEPKQFSRLFDMVLIWVEQKAQYKWCTFKYDCQLNTLNCHPSWGWIHSNICVKEWGACREK